MKPDGSDQRRLTSGAGEEHFPAWSPDGRQIAFIGFGQRSQALYVVNADGTGRRRLVGNMVGGPFAPAWSPGGQRIAFGANAGIYVVNADGSGQRRLARKSVRFSYPVWSPDGRRIAFESNWQVWVVNADGSGQRQLTRKGAHNFNPAWSPDGTRIAFERAKRRRSPCSWCPGLWGYDVYVMNADGSGQQRLTRGASQPQWSPDGRKIAFVSQRAGNPDIYVMNADGSGQRNLTRATGNRESQPVWSPASR
jgi:Tol biopolymer transport system component